MRRLMAVGCIAAWFVASAAMAGDDPSAETLLKLGRFAEAEAAYREAQAPSVEAGASAGSGGAAVTFGGGPTLTIDSTGEAQVTPWSGIRSGGGGFTYASPGGVNGIAVFGADGIPAAAAGDPETAKLAAHDAELGQEVKKILAKYKDLKNDDDRGEAEKKIANLISEQFEIRQKMREKQLTALEDQVKRLRKLQDQRAEQRQRIVTDRVQQLLRDAAGLGWGDSSSGFQLGSPLRVSSGAGSIEGMPAEVRKAILLRKSDRDAKGGGGKGGDDDSSPK